ncbi:MAG TPA: hypothetical protein VEL49_04375 [Ktedonobacteraceae bacterium]|nr:hypothetical protein [Ktedonobacteraceae bacterium]
MQQHTREHGDRSIRARRTQPALPGVTLPTASIVVQQQRGFALPQPPKSKKQPQHAKRAALKLVGLGLLLALLYLAMYPLLAGVGNRPLNQAFYAAFPWLPHLFWTSWASFLVRGLHHIPIFDLSSGASSTTIVNGYPNLLLALFTLTFVLALLASRVGIKVARERLTSKDRSLLFWTVCILTGVFGVIFIFAPGVMSQDVFLYATYGRMASFYNVNPYVVDPTAYTTDIFHIFLLDKGLGVAHYGPLWIDMTLPVVLIARESVVNILFGFRLLGLVSYMVNAMLIWIILAKLKPEMRISGVILFAWNPLVLLVAVSEAHYEIVVITFLLLGVLFFQRRSFLLSWVFVLLATLLNLFCLLLLLFFLKLLWKEKRIMPGGRRFLWWLALTSLSAIIVVLAFAPYWRGLGLMGFVSNLEGTFLHGNAVNSLDAAILYLPMGFPLFLSWLSAPYHWMILAGITIGSLLLFGLWLADTLELVLLFSSWIFLGLTVLLPVHWPWFMLLPLVLAIVSTSRYTILLAIVLTMGAALEYYFLLWPKVWPNLALVTIGLPLLIWGWALFFTATWLMARPKETEQQLSKSVQNFRFSRPSFPSRPSWPGRRTQI